MPAQLIILPLSIVRAVKEVAVNYIVYDIDVTHFMSEKYRIDAEKKRQRAREEMSEVWVIVQQLIATSLFTNQQGKRCSSLCTQSMNRLTSTKESPKRFRNRIAGQ